METLDQEATPAVGPALPSPANKKQEILDECHVEYEVVNGIPCYKENHVIGGHVQIFERIGYDDTVGGTFLGLGADGKELAIRVAPLEATTHVVRAEASFLCKVEAEQDDWRLFSQVHKIFLTDDAFHMSLYFRGGPTLEQCFATRNKFSYGTAGRLAADVLNIIRCAHKHGYLLRNLNLDCFHYDAASRHLFQADISSLVRNVTEGNELIATYVGSLDYAPLVHHKGGKVGARHDLESWYYQLLHLVLGELPWSALSREEAFESKEKLRESKEFAELSQKFHEIASIVFAEGSVVNEEEYVALSQLTEQIFKELGGVTDHEENMDFEREPTPDEIPRLVLCRDDEVEKEEQETNS